MFAQVLNNTALPQASGIQGMTGTKSSTAASDSNPFRSLMETLMAKVDADQTMSMDSLLGLLNRQDADGLKSRNLLTLLSNKLQSLKGADAGSFTVSGEGLSALKTLLNGMGFNADDVDGLIQSLKNNNTTGTVSMKQLFTRLGQFLKDEDSKADIDISSLPYIASLMNSFQIQTPQIEKILGDSVRGGKGIDLDALVSGLKQLQKNQDQTFTASSAGQDALLKGLGLSTESSGTLTLDEFTRKLESLLNQKNPALASAATLANAAKQFNDSIRSASHQTSSDSASALTLHGKNSTGLGLTFETPRLKSPQPKSFENTDSEFFAGLKKDALKSQVKDAALTREGLSSFEKTLKQAGTNSKDSLDNQLITTRTFAGSEMYGKTTVIQGSPATEKTLPAYVTDQVARQISKAVKLGDSEITFHIKPPDMGRVQLSIESTRDGVKINIIAEHHATRDILLSHSGDLRTMLADQGIRLDKIDVDVSGNFGQSMAQARQDAQNSGRERRGKDRASFSMDGVADESSNRESNVTRSPASTGRLDLVA